MHIGHSVKHICVPIYIYADLEYVFGKLGLFPINFEITPHARPRRKLARCCGDYAVCTQ